MASNLIEIILKAINQTDEASNKASDNMKKVGDAAQKANQTASKSSDAYNRKLDETTQKLPGLVQKVNEVGNKGASSFKKLSSTQQDSIVKFNMLDKETQATLQAIHELGVESMDLIPGADAAIAKLKSMDEHVHTFSGSFDYAKSKMELMGTSTDTLKGKIQTVGSGIQTYIGDKWGIVKNKVSGVTSYITSSFSSALSAVGSKIRSLGDAFSGLGGIISSVIGGIGLKELGDMTIGASITRERIYSLSEALLGAGQSTEQFTTLWRKMDEDTNSSLVSLDQLAQSLSVVKQMTGATGDQLNSFEGILLNIGQRAILMGKDGTEAMSLMQAAGKGLNGEFEMLKENFGITRDKLIDAGWTGAADDIDGYTKALEECLNQSGDVSGMMDTTHGKLTSLKKMWGVAGRSIGEEFKPYLDQALTSILKFLDANNDGKLDEGGKKWLQYAYGAMAVASGFATLAPSIAPALTVLDTMASSTSKALKFLGLLEAEEGAVTAATMAQTAAEKLNALGLVEKEVATTALTTEEVALAAAEAGLTAEEIAAASAHASGSAAIVAEGAAASGASFSFLALGAAILSAVWPILLLVGLAVAIYEVGKAFGWWKDIPTMLEAVWSGIQRLWNAFINHPDVQAAISAISQALTVLWGWIQQAGHAVLEFFGINASSKWDIISTMIHSIGDAWQILTMPIRLVISAVQTVWSWFNQLMDILGPFESILLVLMGPIGWIVGGFILLSDAVQGNATQFGWFGQVIGAVVGVFQNIYNAFNTVMNALGPFGNALLFLAGPVGAVVAILRTVVCILLGCSPGIVPALQKTQEVFMSVWNAIVGFIGGVISSVISALQPVIDILTEIGEFIVGQFMESWNAFVSIISIVWSSVSQVINIFQQFMNGQISLTTALSMVWQVISTMYATVLNTIIQRVISFGTKLVTLAINVATKFVQNIITRISQLPGKVGTYLANVASKIVSVGATWVSNARSKAQEIVNGVGNVLSGTASRVSSALSGVVNAIVKPFRDAYNQAKQYWDQIMSLGGAAGGETLAAGGETTLDTNLNELFNVNTGELVSNRGNVHDTLEVTINHNEKLELDLSNVPSHIDTTTLIKALQNRDVLKALTSNMDFQELDNQIKEEILAKTRRARGV